MEPRITLITLGVADLPRAVRFYRDGLGWPTTYEDGGEVAFFRTGGARLSLYPIAHLAADISPDLAPTRTGFSGLTLAHNVRTREEVAQVLAEAAAPAAQPGGIPMMMVVGYVLLFAAMYFFMIAPQRKKQKEHEKLLATLKSGDEIVTSSGIFGVITNVKEDRFVVRVSENTKIEIGKGFVQSVLKPEATQKK